MYILETQKKHCSRWPIRNLPYITIACVINIAIAGLIMKGPSYSRIMLRRVRDERLVFLLHSLAPAC